MLQEHLPARTQKAQGIRALRRVSAVVPFNVPDFKVLDRDEDTSLYYNLPRFGRPCPTRPRHGFVESRTVSTADQLKELWAEARTADTAAELVLMRRLEAVASAVLTPGLLAMGPSNDGATAGKGSIAFPIQAEMEWPTCITVARDGTKQWATLLEEARIGAGEAPYCELVLTQGYTDADGNAIRGVQLRAGVPVPRARDYIPARMAVRHIRTLDTAADSPLAWETEVQQLAPGTVVYHPGGTLASHFAQHCMIRGVPCLTTRLPDVGETIEALDESQATLDPARVAEGMSRGLGLAIDYHAAAYLTLFAFHNSPALRTVPLGSELYGLGVALAFRLGMTAAAGEHRHKGWNKGETPTDRESVFLKAWGDVRGAKNALATILAGFDDHRLWTRGYGGPKWAQCTRATIALYNAMLRLARKSTTERLGAVEAAYNTVLHMAHNGGWWFDKFIGNAFMDWAAAGHVGFYLHVLGPLWQACNPAGAVGTLVDFRAWNDVKEKSVPQAKEGYDIEGNKLKPAGVEYPDDHDEDDSECGCSVCMPPAPLMPFKPYNFVSLQQQLSPGGPKFESECTLSTCECHAWFAAKKAKDAAEGDLAESPPVVAEPEASPEPAEPPTYGVRLISATLGPMTAAQVCYYGGQKLHVQVKRLGLTGDYQKFNLYGAPGALCQDVMDAVTPDCPSYADTGKPYAPLTLSADGQQAFFNATLLVQVMEG